MDLLVPAELDETQLVWVTPKIEAGAENLREWIRGEAVLFASPPPEPDSDIPFIGVVSPPWDVIHWMPEDRAKRVARR